jgi:two-component system cell cycle sensor histidine kinase/response regulator CckA
MDLAKDSRTILVAEDDALTRRLLARLLETAGYRVLEACDGRDALAQICADQNGIDLLLTDVMMPGLDGQRLGAVALALRPQLKVLYTSSHSDRMSIAKGIVAPGLPFLPKTASPGQIVEKVRIILADPARKRPEVSLK